MAASGANLSHISFGQGLLPLHNVEFRGSQSRTLGQNQPEMAINSLSGDPDKSDRMVKQAVAKFRLKLSTGLLVAIVQEEWERPLMSRTKFLSDEYL